MTGSRIVLKIIFAQQFSHVGCVDYLIKKGADLNIRDSKGAAVLHYGYWIDFFVDLTHRVRRNKTIAAFFGQRRITNLLLRKVRRSLACLVVCFVFVVPFDR